MKSRLDKDKSTHTHTQTKNKNNLISNFLQSKRKNKKTVFLLKSHVQRLKKHHLHNPEREIERVNSEVLCSDYILYEHLEYSTRFIQEKIESKS